MKKLKLYLDNCCFNRPYDEPKDQIISLEIESKLFIQEQIKIGNFELSWSFILDFENEENPFQEIKDSIKEWKKIAVEFIPPVDLINNIANKLAQDHNFGSKDALHISCAIYAKCDYIITTDKQMIKKGKFLNNIKIINPVGFISILEEIYDK
jgi:hypothetical protein